MERARFDKIAFSDGLRFTVIEGNVCYGKYSHGYDDIFLKFSTKKSSVGLLKEIGSYINKAANVFLINGSSVTGWSDDGMKVKGFPVLTFTSDVEYHFNKPMIILEFSIAERLFYENRATCDLKEITS